MINFPLNKVNIDDNIDILCNFYTRLQLSEVVEGNTIMLKETNLQFARSSRLYIINKKKNQDYIYSIELSLLLIFSTYK